MPPLRSFAVILAFVCALAPLAAQAGGPAPADEYFGPFKESVLEIRNRLVAFERDTNRDLARNLRGIDTLEVTIEDWYRHYPDDPWIHGFVDRLVRVYRRAHAERDLRCTRARRIARSARR
ncbi:MAG TPA: hypothetical protein VMF11_13945 [Candidatus Baltobacteraceae bacterium]|nr:hypothetical protein [Candidatus Baltobacteraceae bacterium]